MLLVFQLSVCIVHRGVQGYFLNELSTPAVRIWRKLTGDGFVGHNNPVLCTINGLYVFQGMEGSLEVLLIVQ